MGTEIWLGRFFVQLDAATELFWTERKLGGRLYHLLNVGVYDMPHIQKGCVAFNITILYVSFKFGWIPKR
jgi:hypothetical protein